jgi:hypothetical protein
MGLEKRDFMRSRPKLVLRHSSPSIEISKDGFLIGFYGYRITFGYRAERQR